MSGKKIYLAYKEDLDKHVDSTGNPHSVTKSQVGLGNVDNTSDKDKPVSEAQKEAIDAVQKNLENHTGNSNNPHGVTKSHVGLGNVPNVSTDNQTPTYTEASTLAALVSGETIKIAFGKIAKAISSLISHLGNNSNPHSVTKSQVGLGNTENKSSETIRGEMTSANVTKALGYTPISTGNIVQNATTDAADKVPSAAVVKKLQDQITEQNSNLINKIQIVHINLNEGNDLTIPANTGVNLVVNVANSIPSGYTLLGKYPYVRWFANSDTKDITLAGMGGYDNTYTKEITLRCFSLSGTTVNLGMALICQKN